MQHQLILPMKPHIILGVYKQENDDDSSEKVWMNGMRKK